MNDVIEAMLTRRSCRNFKSDMPDEALIREVLRAGSFAATGKNWQSPVVIAVTNRELRDKISRHNAEILGKSDFDPFYGAPVILIVLADKSRPTYLYDGSLVMGNLMLAAHALGLASCWIHRAKEEFESEEGKKLLHSLGIEGEYEGIGHCALGYAAEPLPEAKPRKKNYFYFVN
ncbi:MAG: nitroreductase [Victivallaceae bacterium]|nr:nitroreductase [Victivallaceae bacterium]